ncbi:MAG: ABC transporter related protein [Candidatus Roizmanbacteria bacterium GW2011_GWA2_35_8]|uniref:ABC transporter related protein n=1 Tax=Candidatus Roizmanbacteria bacterium GW2011_GWA2_35_8 TaxID=1618479 RepID=A0A0G0CX58_9BACT|nr:MAG: ABC transporter related protein [Candidatus Roizmanbacteria bacterium GW2011_GWA2_35_8]
MQIYEVFNNLKDVYKNKNIIFISHRFSTVRKADRIYVIEKGEIVENGTHKELLLNKNLYSKFFEIQKKGYE